MEILKKIKQILYNKNLDTSDKLIEIERLLPKEKDVQTTEFFGQTVVVKKEGNAVIFDGDHGVNYVDNPKLKDEDDIFYTGCGCTWGTDLDGNRYHKKYSAIITKDSRFSHLSTGDIINEKARIKKLIMECLSEL